MHHARLVSSLVLATASFGCARDAAMGSQLDARAPANDVSAIHEVCPAGETTFGIDVSYYQGSIDWNAAKADGVQFAIIRVSDGTGFLDPRFDENWANAKAAGV